MLTKTRVDPPLSQIVSGTVDYLVNAFLLDRHSQSVSRGTLRAYTQELTYFSTYIRSAGVVMIEEVTPDILRRYFIDLATHRNPGGVNIAYRVIKTFTYWWERETDNEYRSPIRKVKTPKNPMVPLKGIEPREVLQLINSCKGTNGKRDRAILLTLFDTGVRANELIMIDMGALALPEGRIHITYGKGAKQREVFIGRAARRAIRQYLKERENLYPGTPLFVIGDGERLTYTALKMIIRRRSKQAGLVKVHYPHDFRRAFALECLRNGIDINTIMRLMGQSSPEVIQRYLKQSTEDLRRAHQRASPADNILPGD